MNALVWRVLMEDHIMHVVRGARVMTLRRVCREWRDLVDARFEMRKYLLRCGYLDQAQIISVVRVLLAWPSPRIRPCDNGVHMTWIIPGTADPEDEDAIVVPALAGMNAWAPPDVNEHVFVVFGLFACNWTAEHFESGSVPARGESRANIDPLRVDWSPESAVWLAGFELGLYDEPRCFTAHAYLRAAKVPDRLEIAGVRCTLYLDPPLPPPAEEHNEV